MLQFNCFERINVCIFEGRPSAGDSITCACIAVPVSSFSSVSLPCSRLPRLRQLLALEESSEVGELEDARQHQHHRLRDGPPHHARVGRLARVAEALLANLRKGERRQRRGERSAPPCLLPACFSSRVFVLAGTPARRGSSESCRSACEPRPRWLKEQQRERIRARHQPHHPHVRSTSIDAGYRRCCRVSLCRTAEVLLLGDLAVVLRILSNVKLKSEFLAEQTGTKTKDDKRTR